MLDVFFCECFLDCVDDFVGELFVVAGVGLEEGVDECVGECGYDFWVLCLFWVVDLECGVECVVCVVDVDVCGECVCGLWGCHYVSFRLCLCLCLFRLTCVWVLCGGWCFVLFFSDVGFSLCYHAGVLGFPQVVDDCWMRVRFVLCQLRRWYLGGWGKCLIGLWITL